VRRSFPTEHTVASAGGTRRNFAAVLKLVLTVNDDHLACVDAAVHANAGGRVQSNGNGANFDGVIAADSVNVGSLGATLNGRSGNDREIPHSVHKQVDVDELIGKERAIGIVEDGFQLVRAGGGIDFVVHGQKLAGGDFLSVIAVVSFDVQLNSGAKFGADLRKLILRQAEENSDGLKLGDDHNAVCIVGVNDVSGVHEAQAHASADGSGNPGIGEL